MIALDKRGAIIYYRDMETNTMAYTVRLTNVPDGAYTENYICGPSNGDGSPSQARREFDTREEAEQVVAEFYVAKSAHPEHFEEDMEAEVAEY